LPFFAPGRTVPAQGCVSGQPYVAQAIALSRLRLRPSSQLVYSVWQLLR
jgi:hypothetical protein